MFNWKAKFKNPTFVITFITTIVAFVYQLLGLFDVVPKVSQDNVVQIATLVINAMAALGIIVNPNTKGISD